MNNTRFAVATTIASVIPNYVMISAIAGAIPGFGWIVAGALLGAACLAGLSYLGYRESQGNLSNLGRVLCALTGVGLIALCIGRLVKHYRDSKPEPRPQHITYRTTVVFQTVDEAAQSTTIIPSVTPSSLPAAPSVACKETKKVEAAKKTEVSVSATRTPTTFSTVATTVRPVIVRSSANTETSQSKSSLTR